MKQNEKGFSLIELLIVIVIIGIIAAIAVPNLLASRRAANEGAAVSAVRTIHSSNAAYQATKGGGRFAASLAVLQTNGFIDSSLSSATSAATAKSGYFYTYNGANVTNDPSIYEVVASPAVPTGLPQTGTRNYLISEAGFIYYSSSNGSAPTVDSTTRAVTGGSPLNN